MAIVVTGTPGTGKTQFARKLAFEKGYEYLDLREFASIAGAVEGRDDARDADIINEEQLVLALSASVRKHPRVVIDGHFSHDLPPKYVEKCYVTRCSIKELRKRLAARGYKKEKIEENVQAEIFDTCGQEARDNGHSVEEIWTG